jgi:serine-type D-Ala-D-Ala carboxypeptidase/endopeptidase (penicillin-binding protein 4)
MDDYTKRPIEREAWKIYNRAPSDSLRVEMIAFILHPALQTIRRPVHTIASVMAFVAFSLPLAAQNSAPAANSKPSPKTKHATSARPQDRPDLARFRARVQATLNEIHTQKANWGLLVADRDTGETLFELNSGRFFTPASNAKVFTTAFALSSLGPGYRFRTTLESKSALGADGKLSGDLSLVGRGDPDLSNRKFPLAAKVEHEGPTETILAELADAAVARGLKEVDGDIVADDRFIPYDPYPEGWSLGDLFFSYGAPVTAITFNDNTVSVEILPGAHLGDPAVVTADPPSAAQNLTWQIATAAQDTKPSIRPDLAVVRQPGANFLLLRGSIPLGHAPLILDLAMTDPPSSAARALKQLLEARGVRITGRPRVEEAPPPEALKPGESPALLPPSVSNAQANPSGDAIVLAEHLSPPLLESVRVTNKISQNLHAELFLRAVAREKTGIGSTEIGLALEQDFLHAAGVAEGDAVLSDGSGLSSDNLVTPRAVVALLQYVKSQPWGADFLATLPIAGVDGTLEDRMKSTRAVGLVHAKTGGLEHVHALSGYATTLNGEYLVFSIFTDNNPQHGRDAIAVIDEITAAMIETLGAPSQHKHKK